MACCYYYLEHRAKKTQQLAKASRKQNIAAEQAKQIKGRRHRKAQNRTTIQNRVPFKSQSRLPPPPALMGTPPPSLPRLYEKCRRPQLNGNPLPTVLTFNASHRVPAHPLIPQSMYPSTPSPLGRPRFTSVSYLPNNNNDASIDSPGPPPITPSNKPSQRCMGLEGGREAGARLRDWTTPPQKSPNKETAPDHTIQPGGAIKGRRGRHLCVRADPKRTHELILSC